MTTCLLFTTYYYEAKIETFYKINVISIKSINDEQTSYSIEIHFAILFFKSNQILIYPFDLKIICIWALWVSLIGLPIKDNNLSFGFCDILVHDSPVIRLCSAQSVSNYGKLAIINSPVLSLIPVSEIYKLFNLLMLTTIFFIPSSPTLFPLISIIVKKLIWFAISEQLRAVILLFLISSYLMLLKVEMIGTCLIISWSVMWRLFNWRVFVLVVILMCFHSYKRMVGISMSIGLIIVCVLVLVLLCHVFTESPDLESLFWGFSKELNFYVFKFLFTYYNILGISMLESKSLISYFTVFINSKDSLHILLFPWERALTIFFTFLFGSCRKSFSKISHKIFTLFIVVRFSKCLKYKESNHFIIEFSF